MQDENNKYSSIGFLCGIEIHQRLATKEKLFCSCSADTGRTGKAVASVMRHQRAVAGELGKVDAAAEFEELKDREFVYNVYDENTCLVEVDEEPPHQLNVEALVMAVAAARALGMGLVDELQPMRKSVVDGSDPSAFQRTILVGMEGHIETPSGVRARLEKLFVEEESSGISSKQSGRSITYDIDRLGIPLIEIDTDPNIPTPLAAKEIALAIGTMLRVAGLAQRGLGTIRQDVNVSIRDGARVEIKGLQELDNLDKFVENEVRRQSALVAIKKRLSDAGAKVGSPIDVTDLFSGTAVRVLRGQIDNGGTVLGMKLGGFAGAVGTEVNPDRRLGTEFSDYAKAAGVHGIIHSDEDMGSYGFTSAELDGLSKLLGIGSGDAFVLIAGKSGEAAGAAALVKMRAEYCLVGVPKETRGVASAERCTTRFLRPLPTGWRMYPETDVRPIEISDELLKRASMFATDVGSERARLVEQLKSDDLAGKMMMSPRLAVYRLVVGSSGADPVLVANTLLQKFTELKRNGIDVDSIRPERLVELFAAYSKGRITKQAIDELLKRLAKSDTAIDEAIRELSIERISGAKLKALIKSIAGASGLGNPGVLKKKIMAQHRLTVDGSELNQALGSG